MRVFWLSSTLMLVSAGLLFLVTRPPAHGPRSGVLPSDARALIPLHAPPPQAEPGDWRLGPGRHERGQTFEAWRASNPTTARGARRVLYVVRIGGVDAVEAGILDDTAAFLGDYFGLPVRHLDPIEDIDAWPDASRRDRGGARPQLDSAWILRRVLPPRLPDDAAALLALTSFDLWPGDDWNFVFGQASLVHRVGVWSIARFGTPGRGGEHRTRCLLRTLKVACHETGHMFSMEHCRAYDCVMAGANNLGETDRSPLWLCPECLPKLWEATGVDPLARFGRLAAHARTHGHAAEAAFYERSREALRAARGKD